MTGGRRMADPHRCTWSPSVEVRGPLRLALAPSSRRVLRVIGADRRRTVTRDRHGGTAVALPASSCADGTVTCWGYNADGQLGDGTTTTPPHPGHRRRHLDATDVAITRCAARHTCAAPRRRNRPLLGLKRPRPAR